jgi:peptidyl-Asp metalloendopeptidase
MLRVSGRGPNGLQIVGATLLMLFAVSAAALSQTGAAPFGLTPDQQAIVDLIANSPHGEKRRFAAAASGSVGAEIRLPFREGQYITLVRKGTAVHKDGSISWLGEVEETGERAVLMLWGNALLTGHFAYQGTIFTVESVGGGVHTFAEMERGKLPRDHPPPASRDVPPTPGKEWKGLRLPPPSPRVALFPDAQRQALEAKAITIDVMILYTAKAANHYVRDPADLLALSIEDANQTFRNSGLGNINLRLVHSQLIDYDASTEDQFNHLYRMVDGVGPFKDVKKLRNDKRADIVGLIIDNPDGCGLSTRVGADQDEAFFVVHHACATVSMSIPHEIGHILGARHDRFVDQSDSYGHGYVYGRKWRDLMSYNVGCGGCPRMPFWSNPRVMYDGEPTGTTAADNARIVLENAERVSNFR